VQKRTFLDLASICDLTFVKRIHKIH